LKRSAVITVATPRPGRTVAQRRRERHQVAPERDDRLVALGLIARHARGHDVAQPTRQERRDGRRRLGEHRQCDAHEVRALERRLADGELEERDAEAVDIGPAVGR
jgi:hypothetical protein